MVGYDRVRLQNRAAPQCDIQGRYRSLSLFNVRFGEAGGPLDLPGDESQRGIEALAIPHNANLSNGLMYDWNNSYGRPIDESYAERRGLNEPLSEISQQKGQSETVPALSPNDEFSNFEIWGKPSKDDPSIHGSYVREAYGRGLIISKQTGANPFKFGVVGGSDSHNGLSISDSEPYGDLTMAGKNPYSILARGNLTGVWAENNTRDRQYFRSDRLPPRNPRATGVALDVPRTERLSRSQTDKLAQASYALPTKNKHRRKTTYASADHQNKRSLSD